MRSLMLAVAAIFLSVLPLHAQRFGGFGGGQGGGQPGSSSGTPGGFGGGGFNMGAPRDPNQIFDYLAKGRGYFLVTDTQRLREPLMKYAESKGIRDGKITKEHFAAFNEQMKTQSGGMSSMFGKKGPEGSPSPGGPPSGPPGAPGLSPEEALTKWSEAEFRNYDRNGDGKLNTDEMPSRLREHLDRYDVNKDGLIDAAEFRGYMAARMDRREDGGAKEQPNPVVVLIEEELEQRPVVYRAGKLPKELPKWFSELDTDGDGQIALYEWRVSKSVDEFAEYDRNDDGFITPEEVLRKLGLTGTAAVATGGSGNPSGPTVIRGQDGERPRFGGGGGPPWGGGSGGNPFGGFRKKGNDR